VLPLGTIVSWIALLIGLVAVAYAWKLQQELGGVTRRLDRYNRALFEANEQVRRLESGLAEQAARLRAEMRCSRGEPAAAPDMSVREVIALHPQAQEVLAGFHLGGCSSCAVDPDASLADVCRQSGVDVGLVLANLNNLDGERPVRLPNITFE
jgi:hypothetical protein